MMVRGDRVFAAFVSKSGRKENRGVEFLSRGGEDPGISTG